MRTDRCDMSHFAHSYLMLACLHCLPSRACVRDLDWPHRRVASRGTEGHSWSELCFLASPSLMSTVVQVTAAALGGAGGGVGGVEM